MKKITKTLAITLAAASILSTTAYAASTVPVRSTFESLGFTVSWDQEAKCVSIEKDGFKFCETIGTNFILNNDTTTATQEYIDSIIAAYTKEALSSNAVITEIGEGYFIAETEKLGEVKFMIDENTFIHHEMNKMLYTASDLAEGLQVKVYYSEAMTLSLPPQTYANEVVLLNTEAKLAVSELSQVFTVTDKGDNYILATNEKMGEVMFMVDETTAFRHEMNRRLYTIADVTVGTNLQITFDEAMTASLPPQTHATDVVFLSTEEVETAETATTTGTVTEVGEDYFVVETENGAYQFNVSDETNIHHVMNKMIYKITDLECDMTVEVIHSTAATMSLPPQSHAFEVIIK